ncbi:DUF6883 domain-containing protein [Methylobacterium sp. Leaf99]|uniref:DUF6883 domain-containing protein n=1 Tax=Methylobacterium sp. Leaf99 TaxID=1736251 RepID=UPI000AF5ADD5
MSATVPPRAVAQAKITRYLLNPTHKLGGPKSVFFRAFGFLVDRWEIMAAALAQHPDRNPVEKTISDQWSPRPVDRFGWNGRDRLPLLEGRAIAVGVWGVGSSRNALSSRGRAAEPGTQKLWSGKALRCRRLWIARLRRGPPGPGSPAAPRNDIRRFAQETELMERKPDDVRRSMQHGASDGRNSCILSVWIGCSGRQEAECLIRFPPDPVGDAVPCGSPPPLARVPSPGRRGTG